MDLTSLAVAGMSLIGTLAGTFGGILVKWQFAVVVRQFLISRWMGVGCCGSCLG